MANEKRKLQNVKKEVGPEIAREGRHSQQTFLIISDGIAHFLEAEQNTLRACYPCHG